MSRLQPDQDRYRNARYLVRPLSDRWSWLWYVTRLARSSGLGRPGTADGRGLARSHRRVINNSLLVFISGGPAARKERKPSEHHRRPAVFSGHGRPSDISQQVSAQLWAGPADVSTHVDTHSYDNDYSQFQHRKRQNTSYAYHTAPCPTNLIDGMSFYPLHFRQLYASHSPFVCASVSTLAPSDKFIDPPMSAHTSRPNQHVDRTKYDLKWSLMTYRNSVTRNGAKNGPYQLGPWAKPRWKSEAVPPKC